jgi:hypothetical protein
MAAQRRQLRGQALKDLAAQRKKLSNAASSKAMGEYNAVTRSAAPPKSVRSKNAVTRSPVTPAQMAAQRKQMNAAGSMAVDKFNANVKKGIRNAKPVQATKVSSAQRRLNAAAEERGVSPSAKVRQNPSPRQTATPAQVAMHDRKRKAQRTAYEAATLKAAFKKRISQQKQQTVPKAGQGQTLREQTIRQAASKRKAPTKPNTAGRGPSNRGNTGK